MSEARTEADAAGLVIENGRIVTPDAVIEGGVRIEGDRIVSVGDAPAGEAERIDADGRYVLPGLVDLHGDDVEGHFFPRSSVRMDAPVALRSVDCATISAGITTKFHALSFMEHEAKNRTPELASEVAGSIRSAGSLLADHRVHARCEITDESAVGTVEGLLGRDAVDLVSVMNHTPGQGQYRDYGSFEEWYAVHDSLPRGAARKRYERKRSIPEATLRRHTDRVLDRARSAGVPTASHDNDRPEELERLAERGVDICEYPVTMAAAKAGHDLGLTVAMGAPNLVQGESQRDNLLAADAIAEGVVDVLCVDYHPRSLLVAAFVDTGEPLPDRVARVTRNPAAAVGLTDRGRVEEGARADVIVVREDETPVVERAIVGGEHVYRAEGR